MGGRSLNPFQHISIHYPTKELNRNKVTVGIFLVPRASPEKRNANAACLDTGRGMAKTTLWRDNFIILHRYHTHDTSPGPVVTHVPILTYTDTHTHTHKSVKVIP